MNILTKIICTLFLLIPSISNAIQCDLEDMKGLEFKFTKLSPLDKFSNDNNYKFWFKDKSNSKMISSLEYYSKRTGKIQNEYSVEYIKNKNNVFKNSIVYYYPAVMDDCKTIYLRVNTDDPEFSEHFSKRNYLTLSNKYPDFLNNESLFNVIFSEKYKKFKDAIGKNIHLKSLSSKKRLITKSINSNHSYIHQKPQSTVKLKSVVDIPFIYFGKQLSPYSLIIEKNKEQFYAPTDTKILNMGNKFSSNIRDHYKNDILQGILRYGMNKFEVQMSWGIPQLVRRQVIYLESGMGEFIKDDKYPYAKKEFIHPEADDIPVGIESDWYYFDRLPKGQYLVFDKFGLLREYNQVKTWKLPVSR